MGQKLEDTPNGTAIILTSDQHAGSTVGLGPRTVELDDGGTYRASRGQVELLECWQDFIDRAIKDTEGYKRIWANLGDAGELETKSRHWQIITRNPATKLRIAHILFDPLIDQVDGVIFGRGTPAHTGKSAWFEETLSQDWDNSIYEKKNVASWWHFRGVVSGVRIDLAHHASMGSLPWTERHAAMRVAEIIMWRYAIDRGEQVPHLAARAHNHRRSDSYDNYKTRALCLPCWALKTEYLYRRSRENDLADVGGYVVFCNKGEFRVKKYLYTPAERRIWTTLKL